MTRHTCRKGQKKIYRGTKKEDTKNRDGQKKILGFGHYGWPGGRGKME